MVIGVIVVRVVVDVVIAVRVAAGSHGHFLVVRFVLMLAAGFDDERTRF